ncbi:hypothetical protein QEN19_003137 [Hanseniaspora menglaensis]
MTLRSIDEIDLDSINLLNEMEIISSSLKKQSLVSEQKVNVSVKETAPEINDFLNGTSFSDSDEISEIPNLKNDALQLKRLRAISNTLTENIQRQTRLASYATTDDGCYESAQEEILKNVSNDDFKQSRVASSVIQRIIVSDENDNSRHLTPEILEDQGEDCDNTIMMPGETSQDSDFNSSFSLVLNQNENRNLSSSSQESQNKFKTSRIISEPYVYTLSPVMPLSEQFSSNGERKSTLMQVLDSLSPVSTYSSTFVPSSKTKFVRNSKSANISNNIDLADDKLVRSREILQNIQKRINSEIVLTNEEETKRVASTSSLKNELNKIWDSFIQDDSIATTSVEANSELKSLQSMNLWNGYENQNIKLDDSFLLEEPKIEKTLKFDNEFEMPIQRSSTGLGVYHSKIELDESNKKIVKGNITDLLTKNGVSLIDNSLVYQPPKDQDTQLENSILIEDTYMPSTPKKKNQVIGETFGKNKISSPVKVILPHRKVSVKESYEPVLNVETLSAENIANKCLKLKDGKLENLGYLYISLETLTLSNFVFPNEHNATFKEKNCQIQLLFDNSKKVVESEWVSLDDTNSKYTKVIDLTSQEFATEVPIKNILKNKNDKIFEINLTLKMKYTQPKTKVIEIQDRVPVETTFVKSSNSAETDRSNSLTKIFKMGNKQRQSPKKRNIEYQTITKKINQVAPDPWASNFAPDTQTFATVSLPITLNFIQEVSHLISVDTVVVKSVVGEGKQIGLLSYKSLYLGKTANILPKSISAIQTILEKKEKIIGKRFSGVMYQQGLDLGEQVKRRDFSLEDGNLVGRYNNEIRVVVNLENVVKLIVDSECTLPGYSFELLFAGKNNEKLLLSCDSIKKRREWLGRISEIVDILTVVGELDI